MWCARVALGLPCNGPATSAAACRGCIAQHYHGPIWVVVCDTHNLQALPRPFTKLRELDMAALAAEVAADVQQG